MYEIVPPLLSDIECINEFDLRNPILPYIELLAFFIELFTPFNVEVCSLYNDDNGAYLQIDEANNKFYFTFYATEIEFGIKFDKCFSVPISELFPSQSDDECSASPRILVELLTQHHVDPQLIQACNYYQRIILNSIN